METFLEYSVLINRGYGYISIVRYYQLLTIIKTTSKLCITRKLNQIKWPIIVKLCIMKLCS